MAADAADPVVAEAAINSQRILVSWDRDFGQQRYKQPRFSRLSRIAFSCPEPQGASRLGEVIDLVEFAVVRGRGVPITIRIGWDKIAISC